jgi:hypothetical protein
MPGKLTLFFAIDRGIIIEPHLAFFEIVLM